MPRCVKGNTVVNLFSCSSSKVCNKNPYLLSINLLFSTWILSWQMSKLPFDFIHYSKKLLRVSNLHDLMAGCKFQRFYKQFSGTSKL